MFDDETQMKQDEYQHTYSTAAEYRKHDENWPDFAFRASTFTINKPDLMKPIKNMPASEENNTQLSFRRLAFRKLLLFSLPSCKKKIFECYNDN